MKKLFMLMIVALALSLGSCRITETAQAKEVSLSSRGSIIYQQDGMETALYAEDMILLKNKLDAIPEDTFDPGCYTYISRRESAHEPVIVNVDEPGVCWDYKPMEDTLATSDPSEGDSLESEDAENTSAPTDSSEGDSPEGEDTENTSAPTDPSEGGSPEGEDAENTSAPTDPSEGNLSGREDAEKIPVPDDPSAENPLEETAQPETENTAALSGLPVANSLEIGDVGK